MKVIREITYQLIESDGSCLGCTFDPDEDDYCVGPPCEQDTIWVVKEEGGEDD